MHITSDLFGIELLNANLRIAAYFRSMIRDCFVQQREAARLGIPVKATGRDVQVMPGETRKAPSDAIGAVMASMVIRFDPSADDLTRSAKAHASILDLARKATTYERLARVARGDQAAFATGDAIDNLADRSTALLASVAKALPTYWEAFCEDGKGHMSLIEQAVLHIEPSKDTKSTDLPAGAGYSTETRMGLTAQSKSTAYTVARQANPAKLDTEALTEAYEAEEDYEALMSDLD